MTDLTLKTQKTSTIDFLKQRKVRLNMAIMALIWLATDFNYFLIKFMINTFEQVYITGLLSSFSGLVAYVHGGILYRQLGLKLSVTVTFSLSVIACLVLITFGLDNQETWYFPVMVLFLEYGIAAAFTIVYVSHNDIFPVLFTTTAMGICNFVGRIFAAFAPILAKMHQPLPLMVFGSLSMASVIAI